MSPCDKRLTSSRHRTLFFVMVSITAYIFIIRRTHKKSTSNIGNNNIHKYKATKKEEEENDGKRGIDKLSIKPKP